MKGIAFEFGDGWQVAFMYVPDPKCGKLRGRRWVCAFICRTGDDVDYCVGVAVCSARDNFCRVTGRKMAFGRALEAAKMTRAERFVAWEAFKACCKIVPRVQKSRLAAANFERN